MFQQTEDLTRIFQERLVGEAQAARQLRAIAPARPGLAQRAVHGAGESFVSLGNWLKQVSQAEPAGDRFEVHYNL
jgi:hypothetical protein